jgi:hypothetical protein
LLCASTIASARRFCEPQRGGSPRSRAPRPISASSVGDLLRVDAELLGATAHLHSRTLQLEVGIHAHRDACRYACLLTIGASSRTSRNDSILISHAGGDCLPQLFGALFARPCEAHDPRIGTCVERDLQFAARRDVDAVDQSRHVLPTSAGIGLAFIA